MIWATVTIEVYMEKEKVKNPDDNIEKLINKLGAIPTDDIEIYWDNIDWKYNE